MELILVLLRCRVSASAWLRRKATCIMKISLKDFEITAPPNALHYMISWSHSEPTEGKKITTKISLTSQMFRLVSKWRLCIKLMVDFYFKPLVISHMSSLKRFKKWDLLNISFVSLMRLNWDQMEIVANNSYCSDVFPWETYHSIFSHLSLLKFEFSTNSQTVLGYSMISVCRGCKISLIF